MRFILMDKKKVIFIRGYIRSDKESTTFKNLREELLSLKYDLKLIEIDYNDVNDINKKIEQTLKLVRLGYSHVIGHSLGGFIAMYIAAKAGINSILLNPSTKPYSGEISKLFNEDVKNKLSKLGLYIDNNLDPFTNYLNLAILGKNDKLVDYNIYLDKYFKYTNNILLTHDEHSINISEVIPLIVSRLKQYFTFDSMPDFD